MYGTVLLLCLCSFALLGALPFIFFRPGRKSLRWWLTAAPFFLDAALLIAALAGALAPMPLPERLAAVFAYAAVPLVVAAVALIGCAIGVNRVPLSLWHQENDAPVALVMHGPYARIRHPFYAAFIGMLVASALAFPHPGTLLLLLVGAVQLGRTARREEARLLRSAFGAQYATYMERTGRFLPRLHSPAATAGQPASRRYERAPLRGSSWQETAVNPPGSPRG